MASSCLRFCPPPLCFRRLAPGDVKRIMPVGPVLVGYWICCPSCRRSNWYGVDHFTESVQWTRTTSTYPVGPIDDDDEPTMVERVVDHPTMLTGEVRCGGCGGQMRLDGSSIECEPLFKAV